ncbi:MAG: SRPBCC family protein [Sterolibacterium sp.]|jgi:hypothetical protein
MFKFISIALIAIVVPVAAILVYASTKPDAFHVERSISIKALPEKIFPHINDFRLWDAWTPYNKDPAMKKLYSGKDSGKGAHYAWEGNKDVGKGDITIADTVPPNKLIFDLHMIEPFEGRNVATISLNRSGDFTNVTWSLDDKHSLMLKTVALLIDLNQAIGKDFEVGLSRLKTIAEK